MSLRRIPAHETLPLLALSAVSRVFSDGTDTPALKAVDLEIFEGDYVAIIGPSGSGKSTLLNIIGLLDRPSSGRYRINGEDVREAGERERDRLRAKTFGFVFQSSHVVSALTAASNAGLGLEIAGLKRSKRVERVTRALTTLDLMSQASSPAKNLSGGERQRVAVARAIATQPKIILADEPTGSLDSVNSARVIEYLGELNRQGVTVIIITHDAAIAKQATRCVEIRDGVLHDTSAEGAVLGIQDESVGFNQDKGAAERFALSDSEPVGVGASASKEGRSSFFWRRLALEFFTAISAHTTSPARSLVLIFAFLLGAGGLVSALGVSQSAASQVSERLTLAALDEVLIEDTLTRGPDPISSVSEIEARVLELAPVSGIGWSAPASSGDAAITKLPPQSFLGQPTFEGPLLVADEGYLKLIGADVEPNYVASFFSNADNGLLAIVGEAAAEKLGILGLVPGERLWLNGHPVDVVGVAAGAERDSLLVNSIVLSRGATDVIGNLDARFTVRTEAGFPASVAEALPSAISPANLGRVQTSTVADLRSLRRGVAADLGSFIAIASWILLALSTLSAGTTMFVSVRSRAPEIALRRALGASRASIWRLFSLEGLVIGLAGGVAGSAVGLLSVVVVCQFQQWTPVLSPDYIGVGVLAGVVSGLLSSVYPALVAAFSNPADAVRS